MSIQHWIDAGLVDAKKQDEMKDRECFFPSIEDLARRSDWSEIRAGMRQGLADWWSRKG